MTPKIWNWQLKEWPNFSYDETALKALELRFSQNIGTVLGAFKHVNNHDKEQFIVEVLSDEALKTSEIEGEYLDRDSIQSSIKKNLGLTVDKRNVAAAEFGVSEMRVDLYRNYHKPLSHKQLFNWHIILTNGRRDIADIGKYRTYKDAMQIMSGQLDKPNIHFEAPPSHKMAQKMETFMFWFNEMHSGAKKSTSTLLRAGISHLYFVSIHPFEDGNGRIARSIAEKSISLSIGQPALISMSKTIEANKKAYYNALENNNKTIEITNWLVYFANTILDAQEDTIKLIDFLIEKAKFFDRYTALMNERQLNVILRLFDSGHQGSEGGLSADNYRRIAKTSASTATRDLKDLLDKKILFKTGELKSTRYWLNIK